MLYDLAERYDKALRLLSAQLAKVLVRGDDRERLRQLAATLKKRYTRPDTFDSQTTVLSRLPSRDQHTFNILYAFVTAASSWHFNIALCFACALRSVSHCYRQHPTQDFHMVILRYLKGATGDVLRPVPAGPDYAGVRTHRNASPLPR